MDVSLIVLTLPLLLALGVTVAQSWHGETWALVTALCLVVVYLRVSSRFEGPLLVSVTADHGLVLADLAGLALAVAACLGWWRARRRSRERPTTSMPT